MEKKKCLSSRNVEKRHIEESERVSKQYLQVGYRTVHYSGHSFGQNRPVNQMTQLHLYSQYIDYQSVNYTSARQYRGGKRTGTYVLVCFGQMGPG